MGKTPLLLQRIDELEKENEELKDKVGDLQLAVKSIDHDLQATKREMEGRK